MWRFSTLCATSRATRSGPLDKPVPAKFFQAVRDGNVLHVSVAGQDRRYVLRGTFAALSELVGCALKARDGEVIPSDGMPPHATVAMAPTPPPASPPVIPAPVQPVAAFVPPPVRPMRREVTSSGSGIVVTAEGHVLTNNHVVDGCGSFGLRRVGDEERRATLLAKDSKNDLAVLRAERPYEDVVSFRVEPPRLAESVIVYGFPLSGMLASSGNVTLGRVDKAREGDSRDAVRCDSKLIFMQEIGGDPRSVERRGMGLLRPVCDRGRFSARAATA